MSVLIILMLASLGLGTLFLLAFVWAVRRGQFDDAVTPSMRLLSDDDMKRNREAHEHGTG
jgi:cbb3-type cytochrome oxidase maturation protein